MGSTSLVVTVMVSMSVEMWDTWIKSPAKKEKLPSSPMAKVTEAAASRSSIHSGFILTRRRAQSTIIRQ